jgi:hypothetical protein
MFSCMSALLRKTAAIAGQVRSPIKSTSISLCQSIRLFSFRRWPLVFQRIEKTHKLASLLSAKTAGAQLRFSWWPPAFGSSFCGLVNADACNN